MYGEMPFFTQNSLHHNKLLSLMLPWLYKLQTKLSNSSVILSCKCQCSPNFSKIFFYATFFAIILNGFNFPKPATTFILPQPASTWRLTRAVLVKLLSALLTRKLYAAFNDSFTLLILIILTLLLFPVLKQMFGLFFSETINESTSMKLWTHLYLDCFLRILKYFVLDLNFHFWCIRCWYGFSAIHSQNISVTCLNFTISGFSVIVVIKSWTTSNELSTTSSFCSNFSNLFVVTIRLKSQTRLTIYSFLFN